MKLKPPSLSVVFPTFNDGKSIPTLVKKTLSLLPKLTNDYEIIIVNDGSKDNTGEVLRQLQKEVSFLKVVTNEVNQGYGAALVNGFKKARKDFIFYTDSDGQYDVMEIKKLLASLGKNIDIVTGFKLNRADAWYRRIIGGGYNQFVKIVFGLKIKDVDCDFRLFRRTILDGVNFKITSGAFDVEFVKKLQEKKARFKEVPIRHYPRLHGRSQFFNFKKISESLWDLVRIRFLEI